MRIRSTKPEFWQDEKLAHELTRDARLLYKALWNEADDEGRLRGSEAYLHGALFPYDPGQWFHDSLESIIATGRAVRYEADGATYLYLTKLIKNQKINKPSKSKLPPPPVCSGSIHVVLPESSGSPPSLARAREEQVAGSREQVGVEVGVAGGVAEASPPVQPALPGMEAEQDGSGEKANGRAKAIFDYWKEKLGHPQARLDEKRRRRIEWALRQYDEPLIRKAIDGCAASAWHRGDNPDRKVYDDVALILRDAEHLERFAAGEVVAEVEPPKNY